MCVHASVDTHVAVLHKVGVVSRPPPWMKTSSQAFEEVWFMPFCGISNKVLRRRLRKHFLVSALSEFTEAFWKPSQNCFRWQCFASLRMKLAEVFKEAPFLAEELMSCACFPGVFVDVEPSRGLVHAGGALGSVACMFVYNKVRIR